MNNKHDDTQEEVYKAFDELTETGNYVTFLIKFIKLRFVVIVIVASALTILEKLLFN